MEDMYSPQRGDCSSFPIVITDSPEVRPGRSLGVPRSPVKAVTDPERKHFNLYSSYLVRGQFVDGDILVHIGAMCIF